MTKEESDKYIPVSSSLFLSAKGLQGKQSVRATFRLPEHIINLLGVVASQLGIKQKSLFDQLIEDETILTKVAEQSQDGVQEREKRRQKTYVLSRRSLHVLDTVARQQKIPRDVLVQISVERLLPVIDAEQEKHEKRKRIYKDLQEYLRQGQELLHKTEHMLGKDDQASVRLRKIVQACEANAAELAAVIESGRAIEDLSSV